MKVIYKGFLLPSTMIKKSDCTKSLGRTKATLFNGL